MAISSFPGGFPNGLVIKNLSMVDTVNNRVFWVCNNTGTTNTFGMGKGSDSNPGTFSLPLATITKAVSLCSSTRADTIIVAAGHAETITTAGGIAISKAGCSVIGLGSDTDRPTLTLATSAAASVNITGANAGITNVLIKDTIGATSAVNLKAVGASCTNCSIRNTTGTLTAAITINGGGANSADKCNVVGNTITALTATNGIVLSEVDDQVDIVSNIIMGPFSDSAIKLTAAHTLARVTDNTIQCTLAGGIGINSTSTGTGILARNSVQTVSGAPIVPGSMAVSTVIDGQAAVSLVSAIKVLPQTVASPGTTVFTVAGGPIRILSFGYEVTTVVQTQADNFKFTFTDTASSTATDVCANLNITAQAVGTFAFVKGDAAATALTAGVAGIVFGKNAAGFEVPAGTMGAVTSASNTGNIKYRLTYIPLAPNVSVTMS